MICKDFQQKWNELLDSETDGSTGASSSVDEAEALLLAHAADCPTCRPIAARYQALRHAIRAWRQPPAPPADLVERILSEPIAGAEGAVVRRSQGLWTVGSRSIRIVAGLAAAVLVAAGLSLTLPRIDREPGVRRHEIARDLLSVSDGENAPPALNRALAEATSATWDLARSASQPAARIGRDVLDATVRTGDDPTAWSVPSEGTVRPQPDEGLASLTLSVPSLSAGGVGTSDMLQQVGDQVSEGVRPLSSTARHAFGFLLGPPPAAVGDRPGGSTTTGARSG